MYIEREYIGQTVTSKIIQTKQALMTRCNLTHPGEPNKTKKETPLWDVSEMNQSPFISRCSSSRNIAP